MIPPDGGTLVGTTSGTGALSGSCSLGASSPERVFQWTPAATGTTTIQTCGAGTNFDTVLYMRSGGCATGGELACNDDGCDVSGLPNKGSHITATVTAGQTYYIVVDGYNGASGTFTLTVPSPTPLPAACTSPIVIPANGGTVTGTTTGASSLAGSCGSSGSSPERVFQWTPTKSGTATFQTCGGGTNFDTVLYVRGGNCALGGELGCNDDACDVSGLKGVGSKLTLNVIAGQTYYIVVDGYGGSSGTYSLNVKAP